MLTRSIYGCSYACHHTTVSLAIISEATDGTMCPGVDSASENEYQDTPGGKDDQCVRVTTLPPS
jgi:hypothetical protein